MVSHLPCGRCCAGCHRHAERWRLDRWRKTNQTPIEQATPVPGPGLPLPAPRIRDHLAEDASVSAPGNEDQLTARAVGSVPDFLHGEPCCQQ